MAGKFPQREELEVLKHSQNINMRTPELGIVTQGLGPNGRAAKILSCRR